MHYSKRLTPDEWLRRLCPLALLFAVLNGYAQTPVEISQWEVERGTEDLTLSVQLQFDLSVAVEEALQKGVPLYFRAEADVLKERWYWYDKLQTSATRQYKLAYQPLTKRWRLNVSAGVGANAGQGLALSQNFDSLPQAIESIKRVSKWRIAGAQDLDPHSRYRLDFRFQLDVSQLPRPFQIGVLGQTDWDISISRSQVLLPENSK
ncbi:MAG: DUF4390 domain-containing protein [Rhodoferax sp.]|nr:DUF4390 domain-containing protein [Rhodoferax sp.]